VFVPHPCLGSWVEGALRAGVLRDCLPSQQAREPPVISCMFGPWTSSTKGRIIKGREVDLSCDGILAVARQFLNDVTFNRLHRTGGNTGRVLLDRKLEWHNCLVVIEDASQRLVYWVGSVWCNRECACLTTSTTNLPKLGLSVNRDSHSIVRIR
jgi:hypothetical protein